MPVNGLILPRPSAAMFGRCRPRRRAMLPRVSAPGGSPKNAASGMAPMPTLSRTIQMMRRNTRFERNTRPARPSSAAIAGRGRRIRSLLNDGQRRRNQPRLERSAGGAEFNSLCRIQSQRLTCLNLLLFTNSQVFDLLIYCVLVDDRASRADLPAFFGGSCILFSFYLGLLCSGFRLFSFLLSRQSLPECCFSRIIFRLSFGSFSFLFGFSLSGSSSLLSLCRRFNLTFGFDFQKLFLQIRWLTSYPVNASFRVLRKDQAGSNDFGLAAVHLAG